MAQPIWVTPAGSLGSFSSQIATSIPVVATPVLPASNITYTLISGYLPLGLTLNKFTGLISGTPGLTLLDSTTYTFTIRATDNNANLRDRTFSITISGAAAPSFTTPTGSILSTNDSVWVDLPIQYSNPNPNNSVQISVIEGILPPGLEINRSGRIRGYPEAPVTNIILPVLTTSATITQVSNIITCVSTTGFTIGRPVVFSGTVFGNIVAGTTYYIREIIDSTRFTISTTQNGPEVILSNSTGYMDVRLSSTVIGQPVIRTYTFTLLLSSLIGDSFRKYSITVINQNTPSTQGGPGFPKNTRIPTIYNTRPPSYVINNQNPYSGYYILPVDAPYDVYPTNVNAPIGKIRSGEYFSFKILGKDFDRDELTYEYLNLPLGLTGDTTTGWITGVPVILSDIGQYSFSVAAYKTIDPNITTPFFNFSFTITNSIDGTITWITPADLGNILNGTISIKSVEAVSDVSLKYRVVSGSLPPNLILLSNGEISGYVANQPTNAFLNTGDNTTFTFTIEAYSQEYSFVSSTKTFTLKVVQKYGQPTDTLYMKATPTPQDRRIIESLLTDDSIIVPDLLYRPKDRYFGKATNVTYEHAFGIYASDLEQYLSSVTRNHYWRNITLGEIKTAVAKDQDGNVVYEVVYSEVIDNLVNPKGKSVSSRVYWPTVINLFLGPWYTSSVKIFTSYEEIQGQKYYTSLTPGSDRALYPNSLYNMRTRVGNILGQEYDSGLLPLWMSSQQANGSTLGYTQAWVICYTKPGCSSIIKNNIENNWKSPDGTPYKLNQINFGVDRFSVNKTMTYDFNNHATPPAWTQLPSGSPPPNPLDSKDFYVLFPRKTILSNTTQY